MKNENLSDGEMNIVDSAVQQIGKSESRLKGRRLYRRLPISTATGRADSVRAFRKLTKWMSQSRHLSTKKKKNPLQTSLYQSFDCRLTACNSVLTTLDDLNAIETLLSPPRPEPIRFAPFRFKAKNDFWRLIPFVFNSLFYPCFEVASYVIISIPGIRLIAWNQICHICITY